MVETRTLSLPVTLPKGFDECGRCMGRLRDSLMQLDGVSSVEVNPQAANMTLVYDPHLTPLDVVVRRANSIGVELRERFQHKTVRLTGLDCPDCAMKLEKAVGRLDGVLWVTTNFASARLSVEYDPSRTDLQAIARRVREMGYGLDESEGTAAHQHAVCEVCGPAPKWQFGRQTALTAISAAALIVAIILSALGHTMASKVLFGLSALAGGLYAARGAVYSLKSFVLDMNFLMTVAAIGAIAIGEWFDAAMVMLLYSLGNTLEARSVERARDSVRSLVNLFPTQARVRRDGVEVEVPASDVAVGEVFVVRPGEKIPTDGVILAGGSSVNQAAITGESVPVEKTVGDEVFAGSMNVQGSMDVRASATAQDNTLARIVHMVEAAQAEKAPTQRFTEEFGRFYTPIVVGLAVLVALVPPFVFGAPFDSWLYRALTLLVVSCPCALVISTPVSIVSAIGNAARRGVLVKGGSHLETAGDVTVVAFDKTGTITTGQAEVTDITPVDERSAEELLALAASVESRSEHPLADAIRRAARERGVAELEVTDFEALTGMGAAARFDGATCVVGNTRLMEQLGVDISAHIETLTRMQEEGKTAVMVAQNVRLAGIIAVRDTVRNEAKSAFAQLRRAGIEKLVMLTGDNEATARAVARDLEIDEYYAELLPKDKVDIIRVLIERFGSRVAMVGDGVNDAPALAAATLGIAMGAAGSDTAIETSDVALMSDDLQKLPFALRLGRRTLATVKQNIAFSLAVIVVLIVSALFGRLTLSWGVLGHEGSALIVIANGMRLLRFR